MSFSYDRTSTTTRNIVRLLIGDTEASSAIYEDEEIDRLVELESDAYMVAALAFRAKAARFAEKTIAYTIGTTGADRIQIDRRKVFDAIMTLADKFEALAIAGAVDERFDRFAFDIDAIGRDVSDYQGITLDDDIL